jgi:hypothetical protein
MNLWSTSSLTKMETHLPFPFPRFFEGVAKEEKDPTQSAALRIYTFRLKEMRGKEIHDLGISVEGIFSGTVSDYGLGLLQKPAPYSGKVKVSGLMEQDTFAYHFGRSIKRAAVSPNGKTFLLAFPLSQNPYPWIPDFSEKYVEVCLFRTEEGDFHFFEGNYELLVLHLGFIDNKTWYITGLSVGEMGRIKDFDFSDYEEALASVRGKKWYTGEDIMYFDRDFFFPLGNGYFITEGEKHLSLCKLTKRKWGQNFDNFEIAKLPMYSDLEERDQYLDKELTFPRALHFELVGENLMGGYKTEKENEYRLLIWKFSDLGDKLVPPLRRVEYSTRSHLLSTGEVLGVDIPFQGWAITAYSSCDATGIHAYLCEASPLLKEAVDVITGFL